MHCLTCIDRVGMLCLKQISQILSKPLEEAVKYTEGLVGLQQASVNGEVSKLERERERERERV